VVRVVLSRTLEQFMNVNFTKNVGLVVIHGILYYDYEFALITQHRPLRYQSHLHFYIIQSSADAIA
jgi:hypothetical protein